MAKPQNIKSSKKNYGFLIFLALATLATFPILFDAFFIPKTSIIIAGAIWLALSAFTRSRFDKTNNLQIILIILSMWLLLLVVTSDNTWVSLFGVFGRATGLLFYLALIVIMWRSAKFTINEQKNVYAAFGHIGLATLIYGLLQYLSADPISWNLVYEGIIGVFGNPNFMGAFAALVGIFGVGLFFNISNNFKFRLFGLALVLLSLINIHASNARQGYVSLAIGAAPILVFVLFKREKTLGYVGLGASGIGLVLFTLGLIQKGPLAEIVYKQSVSYRGDFWRTATNMVKENPLFGVGFERFGVNYRGYRDLPQVLRNGVDAYSDNAHNIYLHFAATGGVTLALIYLVLNVYVFLKFVTKVKSSNEHSYFYVSIFSIWLAIQAQSLISVDTPSIAIWGWVFAGFICSSPSEKISKSQDFSPAKILGVIAVMAFGVLAIFQFNAQSSMRNAFYLQIPKNDQEYAKAKAEILIKAERHESLNPEWPILSANSLIQDEAYQQTIEAANRAVELDPKDYRGWYFLASAQEKLLRYQDAIKSRLAASNIDPFNAENLLNLGRDYKALGKNEEAKQIVEEIKKFAPNSAEYQTALNELD